MDDRERLRRFEEQFLRQLRNRAATLIRGGLPADRVQVEPMPDGVESVRAVLSRLEKHDRSLLEQLPGTRAVQMRFQRRIFGPLRTTIARLRAQVLVPTEALVAGQKPGPVTRDQLLDAMARYHLLPRDQRPTAVVFASATGFTPEAEALVDSGGPALILLTGRDDGGWSVNLPHRVATTAWAKLFELESQDERMQRLLSHLDRNSHLLDSRGMSMAELAEQLGLSPDQAESLVRRAARSDARIMTVQHDGRLHVARSPLAEEGDSLSVWTRIRRLLRLKPTVAEQVRELTARRLRFEQERIDIDRKVDALVKEESAALERAKGAANDAERAQIVGTLKRVRSALVENRAMAAAYSNKIDILGTQIHNLKIASVGERKGLPTREDVAREAAQAEQVTTELAADADFARGVRATAGSPISSAEDEAIWAEVRALGQQAAPPAAAAADERGAGERRAEGPAAVPPVPPQKSRARPELG